MAEITDAIPFAVSHLLFKKHYFTFQCAEKLLNVCNYFQSNCAARYTDKIVSAHKIAVCTLMHGKVFACGCLV